MAPNREQQERERGDAERKASADALEIASKVERVAGRKTRKARRRRALIKDAIIAIAVAVALVGVWKLIPLLARVVAVP